jgi:hypothetical protein
VARGLVFVLATTAACTQRAVPVDIPTDPTTKSMVVALDVQGKLQVAASNIDHPSQLPYQRDVQGAAKVTAILYDRTLMDLDVREGLLIEAKTGDFSQGLPPAIQKVESAKIEDGNVGEFTKESTAASRLGDLSSFRYRVETPCSDFDTTTLMTQPADQIDSAAALDDATAIAVGTIHHVLFQVDHHGTKLLPAIPGFEPLSAFGADGQGRIWLAGTGGVLYVGRPETGFTYASTSPRKSTIRWMAGPRTSSIAFELYTVSIEGSFERFDGVRWQLIKSRPFNDLDVVGGVAWVGPGDAVAAIPQVPPVFNPADPTASILVDHFRLTGTSSVVSIPFSTIQNGKIAALENVPGFGVVAYGEFERLLVLNTEDRFDDVVGPVGSMNNMITALHRPRGLAPFLDGFVYVGDGVELAQFSKQYGYCKLIAVSLALESVSTIPVGRSYFLFGHDPAGASTPFAFFDPR